MTNGALPYFNICSSYMYYINTALVTIKNHGYYLCLNILKSTQLIINERN